MSNSDPSIVEKAIERSTVTLPYKEFKAMEEIVTRQYEGMISLYRDGGSRFFKSGSKSYKIEVTEVESDD